MRIPLYALSLLVPFIMMQSTLAAPVTVWVPPYSIGACKTMLQRDFGGVGMKDGVTVLALQFWQPDGASVKKSYGSTPSDADIAWFVNWGHQNNIKVLLCLFNPPINGNNYWDWDGAVNSFRYNQDAFVNSLVAEIDRLGLDGIDVDIEGNAATDVLNQSKAAYVAFMKQLSEKLHAKGKIVTYASFADQWNAPNWDWWADVSPFVDGLETMGYDYSGRSKDYASQVQHATSANVPGFQIGMPGWLGTWQGNTVLEQLDWVIDNGTIGMAIWDAALENSGWQTAAVWNKIKQIAGTGNGPYTLSVNASHGMVSVDPEQETYDKGTEVTVEAVADADYCFAGWSSGETDAVRTITVDRNQSITPLFAPMSEQIVNGGFSNGETGWDFGLYNGGTGSGAVVDGAFAVTVTTGKPQSWSLQLKQEGLALVKDSLYSLTFTAWADAERDMEYKVGQSVSPYSRYNGADSTIHLTTEPQTFTRTFTMEEATDFTARVEFNGGFVGADWSVDNISLKMGPADETALHTASGGRGPALSGIRLTSATVGFVLGSSQTIGIRVVDLSGRTLMKKTEMTLSAGHHELPLSATGRGAGVGIVMISGDSWQQAERCMILP